jgi:hypothetical protein
MACIYSMDIEDMGYHQSPEARLHESEGMREYEMRKHPKERKKDRERLHESVGMRKYEMKKHRG